MKDSEYQCNMCGGVYEKGWTEEEAKAEAKENGFPLEESSLVCDPCYRKIMGMEPAK